MVFTSAMKLAIPHVSKRPVATRIGLCVHSTLRRSYGSQDPHPFSNSNVGQMGNQVNNGDAGRPRNGYKHGNSPKKRRQQPNNPNLNSTSTPVARYTHQPRQRWMNVNPARASINIYRHRLLSVQYCSAVLLLRTHGILLNPFHPLLRTALQRHQETYEIGYFFHLHTSSKLVTGKQSSVRKGIRGKVRAAWEQVLTKRGYDVKTGKFTGHLKPGFDRSLGHVILPDLKGTVSINPNEACSNAPYQDIIAACEHGLEAVLNCKHRNMTLEEWMKPENLWRFYDWKRRDLLNKYMAMGHGLGHSNEASQIFRSALIGLRSGKTDIRMNGTRTPEGGYLVDLDGETFDLAPLRGPSPRKSDLEQRQFNDDDTKLFQEAFEKGDVDMEGLFGGANDDEFGSGDLDWGLDDIEPEGDSRSTSKEPTKKQPQYLDDF
ncbi:hypothetical protein TWF106_008572 [Orbilia oligospora]|uniref:Uncharacterized protein n=1 Tax=Orbilia oligospora TaxID=2813651 RepID=A0A6G1LYF1_ORBOL|nr:hypothetical protein TWF788_005620 [Orbilia oligospora]KAF3197591.1 hypothetical protein TWF679_002921 [Orbilia oligospora]KAF3216070.1 hypothetical protein TWF106_008572 [Orbilia oligospora]KAF3238776.1 hypothetical protein TWF192_010242 [Orbilia oligospora]